MLHLWAADVPQLHRNWDCARAGDTVCSRAWCVWLWWWSPWWVVRGGQDEATRILKEATKLVDEMEMMRERVDKGVSYNPSCVTTPCLPLWPRVVGVPSVRVLCFTLAAQHVQCATRRIGAAPQHHRCFWKPRCSPLPVPLYNRVCVSRPRAVRTPPTPSNPHSTPSTALASLRYAEKQFRKIIKPCRGVLREARDALAKRAYTMTHRARNKLTKLVAHNEAAGAPDDDATAKILVRGVCSVACACVAALRDGSWWRWR